MKRVRLGARIETALLAALAVLAPSLAHAEQARLNVGLAQPVLKAGQKQTTFLKVGLTGFTMKDTEQRTPVNVALVLDRSGSMAGEKLRKAKEAALNALDRLGPNDIVSVVTFESTVHVLVPATKLTDKVSVREAIQGIEADGSTALFAGVSKGAEEVRKFHDRNRVNRVVLLTDGLANVGPGSPKELGALGASLKKEGIAVTTLGLGQDYNEDLLTALAGKSDGNHGYVKSADELNRFFTLEFGDVLAVVAQEVAIEIHCAEGIRPVRVLGREAEIAGQTVVAQISQIYSRQEKFVMLEVEIPATLENQTREIATVKVSYANMATRTTDKLTSAISARFVKSDEQVEQGTNRDVMVSAVEMVANETNMRATALRDQGKVSEARDLLQYNFRYLQGNAEKYNADRLRKWGQRNFEDSENLDNDSWRVRRKEVREYNFTIDTQQKK